MPGCEKPPEPASSDIVINELQPVNSSTVTDQNGEYDDWVELYNKSDQVKDISGYFLFLILFISNLVLTSKKLDGFVASDGVIFVTSCLVL